MSHKLVYTRRAVKDIQKLDDRIKKRIAKALLKFSSSPLDSAEKLTNSKLGSYRFRIGDMRVVFDMDGKDIVVLRVGHRREIYKR